MFTNISVLWLDLECTRVDHARVSAAVEHISIGGYAVLTLSSRGVLGGTTAQQEYIKNVFDTCDGMKMTSGGEYRGKSGLLNMVIGSAQRTCASSAINTSTVTSKPPVRHKPLVVSPMRPSKKRPHLETIVEEETFPEPPNCLTEKYANAQLPDVGQYIVVRSVTYRVIEQVSGLEANVFVLRASDGHLVRRAQLHGPRLCLGQRWTSASLEEIAAYDSGNSNVADPPLASRHRTRGEQTPTVTQPRVKELKTTSGNHDKFVSSFFRHDHWSCPVAAEVSELCSQARITHTDTTFVVWMTVRSFYVHRLVVRPVCVFVDRKVVVLGKESKWTPLKRYADANVLLANVTVVPCSVDAFKNIPNDLEVAKLPDALWAGLTPNSKKHLMSAV